MSVAGRSLPLSKTQDFGASGSFNSLPDDRIGPERREPRDKLRARPSRNLHLRHTL